MNLPLVMTLVLAAGRSTWPPEHLSQTGLLDAADPGVLADGVRPFSPQYPLWSDGATKRRWVFLPKGTSIDASDPDVWRFPVGTRFWKEFSFGGRKVETRYLEKTGPKTWVYASYAWRDDGREAVLVPAATGLKNHVEIAPGIRHDIPSVSDCKACHEGQGRDAPLGYGALQLSRDRDPLAPHAEPSPEGALDLHALLVEKRLNHAPSAWLTTPPVIAAPTPRARAVLGYLHGNCSNCHNGSDAVSSVGLSFRVSLSATCGPEQPLWRTAVDVKSKFQIRGVASEACRRVASGNPDHSALVVRMRSRDGLSQMPPLGSKLVDASALELVSGWVASELPSVATPESRERNASP